MNGKTILFKGAKRGTMTRAFELLAGFLCPKCGAILKAYFETRDPVLVWKYEGVEKEHESKYQTFTVPGGQGMVAKQHDSDYRCGLQVYWASSLKDNLLKWFEDHGIGYQLRSIVDLMQKVREGGVDGLIGVGDICGSDDTLLVYDSSKWEVKWNSSGERWEDYKKRRDELFDQRLKNLGCVVAGAE